MGFLSRSLRRRRIWLKAQGVGFTVSSALAVLLINLGFTDWPVVVIISYIITIVITIIIQVLIDNHY